MLALTECHEGKQRICAATIGNPIVDWTALIPTAIDAVGSEAEETLLVSRTPSDLREQIAIDGLKSDSLSVNDLLTLRNSFFTKPEKYFDPFASPSLFFRTPSSDLPRDTSPNPFINSSFEAEELPAEVGKKRRSHRKYPSVGSGFLLPHMRVEVGKCNALKDQGVEFMDLMRRSLARSTAENASSGKHVEIRTCDLVEREDLGLWSVFSQLSLVSSALDLNPNDVSPNTSSGPVLAYTIILCILRPEDTMLT